MTQQTMFDLDPAPAQYDDMPLAPVRGEAGEGERRKRAGIARAAASKDSELGYARELAADIARARPDRRITADDVALALEAEGRAPLGNAAGHLFQVGPWHFTGDWIESTRPQSHRNRLRVWRYDG